MRSEITASGHSFQAQDRRGLHDAKFPVFVRGAANKPSPLPSFGSAPDYHWLVLEFWMLPDFYGWKEGI